MLELDETLRRCRFCGSVYAWRQSSSRYLKMTFCTFSCERKANGCLIDDFDYVKRTGLTPTQREELARLMEAVAG